MSVLKIVRISKADIQRKVGGKFKQTCTLVSDKHRSIAAFAKSEGIQHKRFTSTKYRAENDYHVQNVNNMPTKIKHVVNHQFRDVSTKYLQYYSNCFG